MDEKELTTDSKKLLQMMLSKSQESFLLAIELYNRPTLSLNIDSFCIFICNAWELLFKARLLSQGKSIYFKSKDKNRTYDLSKLIKLNLTNDKDLVRVNLEIIVGLRNKATHLIIPEYASMFNDVFLAAVRNYTDKIEEYFQIKIGDKFKTDFLTLFIPTTNDVNILKKYGKTIHREFYNLNKYISSLLAEKAQENIIPQKLAVTYDLRFKKVNAITDANLTITKVGKGGLPVAKIIEEIDPGTTHPFSNSKILNLVKKEIESTGITFTSYVKSGSSIFTQDTLNLYIRAKKIKDDKSLAYPHSIGKNINYTYSIKLVEKIIEDITNDSDIFVKLKKESQK